MVLDLRVINTIVINNNNNTPTPIAMYKVFKSVVSDEESVEGPTEGPMASPKQFSSVTNSCFSSSVHAEGLAQSGQF